jgi:hypothetical protein
MRGGSLKTLQEILGHADYKMTPALLAPVVRSPEGGHGPDGRAHAPRLQNKAQHKTRYNPLNVA